MQTKELMVLSEDDLFAIVEKTISEILFIEEGTITKETLFVKDLNVQSLEFLDISLEIENQTGISINFGDIYENLKKTTGKEVNDISILDLIILMKQMIQNRG